MTPPLWTSDQIAAAVGGRNIGGAFAATGIAIDSREVAPGDLFVALAGARAGEDFAAAAFAVGAVGVLAGRPVEGSAVIVPDTLAALRALAEAARQRAPAARRAAITGSVGKTSVTQAVKAGLERAGAGHGPVRSFNNQIGVPLTLARMPPETRRAVFELGMNHAGEIAPLSRLVRPHVAAITTVEAVHVENFADGEAGVAAAKAEIFAGLERGGTAVLNADNRWFDDLKGEARRAGAKVRAFGTAEGAAARLVAFSPARGGASVSALIDGAPIEFPLRQSAAHWGPMSLCALLVLEALEVERDDALAALAAFEPLAGRGAERVVRSQRGCFVLIDESWNASPVAVRAALAALAARRGRKIVALTDMLELGEASAAAHAGLAEAVEAAGIDQLFCAGPAMRRLFDAVPAGRRGAWSASAETLAPTLVEAVRGGDVVMVKGSKASKASLLVSALAGLERTEGEA